MEIKHLLTVTFNEVLQLLYAQINCGSHLKVGGVIDAKGRIDVEDSMNFGSHNIGDSIVRFTNDHIDGDETHVGRIQSHPGYGQAQYRVEGYLDFRFSDKTDWPKPVWRFLGGKTPNTFTNQTEQEKNGKVEIKGELETTGQLYLVELWCVIKPSDTGNANLVLTKNDIAVNHNVHIKI